MTARRSTLPLMPMVVLLTALLAGRAPAQPAPPAGEISQAALAAFVADGQTRWEVPGIAVAAVMPDGVLEVTRGTTRLDGDEAVTADTAFAIASTTKAMIAAALAILVDRGEFGWTDPVRDYFPALDFEDAYVTRHLRVIDLLTHSTGLPSTDPWSFVFNLPMEEQIARMATVPFTAAYRQRFQYQNTMYELAGELIERLTGTPWYAFLRTELWQPLGMIHTYGSLAVAKAAGQTHVEPHHRVEGKVTPIPYFPLPEDRYDAAGSVWSTLADMTRWVQFLLRGGTTVDGERLVSEAEFERLFAPQVLIAEDDFYPTHQLTQPKWRSYGLGWFQQDYAGRRIDFHTGSLGGLCAIVGLDRDAGTGVIVLENLDHAEVRHAIMWEVFDPARRWNDEVQQLYATIGQQAQAQRAAFVASRVADTRPTLPLAAYAGAYQHPAWGEAQVQLVDGELRVPLANYTMELRHWHFDTFLAHVVPWYTPQPVRFEVGVDGSVTALFVGDQRYDRIGAGADGAASRR